MAFVLFYPLKMIADNVKSVTQAISKCCEKTGRPAGCVKLVCVTKEAGISQIEEVLGLGLKDLGENRVQDLAEKYNIIGATATWHLVGHLQTNKIPDAVAISALIHSVDSLRLAAAVDKEAGKLNKVQDVLIQVNTSTEESKFGIAPDEVSSFFREVSSYPNINISGLMTIAPEVEDPEEARPCFRRLRELRDELSSILNTRYPILSMGMTNDFEVAIEEGATVVRIGRAIFGV